MTKIKCIENLKRLKEMLLKGEKGDAGYFSAKLDVSERTFYRLMNYLKNDNKLKIRYDRPKEHAILKDYKFRTDNMCQCDVLNLLYDFLNFKCNKLEK